MNLLQKNVGRTDKLIRIIVGLALLSLLVLVEGEAKWLGLIGLVPLLTALLGTCPAYTLLGVNSCGKDGGCCMGKPGCANKNEPQA